MKENVVKLLKEQMWYLGTYSDEPNAIPVAFKDVTEDGKLVVGDVFLNVTLKNIEANGKIAVSAYVQKAGLGYVQRRGYGEGRACHHTREGYRHHARCAQRRRAVKQYDDSVCVKLPGRICFD